MSCLRICCFVFCGFVVFSPSPADGTRTVPGHIDSHRVLCSEGVDSEKLAHGGTLVQRRVDEDGPCMLRHPWLRLPCHGHQLPPYPCVIRSVQLTPFLGQRQVT